MDAYPALLDACPVTTPQTLRSMDRDCQPTSPSLESPAMCFGNDVKGSRSGRGVRNWYVDASVHDTTKNKGATYTLPSPQIRLPEIHRGPGRAPRCSANQIYIYLGAVLIQQLSRQQAQHRRCCSRSHATRSSSSRSTSLAGCASRRHLHPRRTSTASASILSRSGCNGHDALWYRDANTIPRSGTNLYGLVRQPPCVLLASSLWCHSSFRDGREDSR